MRFGFKISTNTIEFPIEYRVSLISWIKNALSNYQNGAYFDEVYGSIVKKDFTFAVKLPEAQFQNDKIILPAKNFTLYLSSGNPRTSLILYNSLALQKNKKFPLSFGNEMILTGMFIENEIIIKQPKIYVHLMMPLCVRDHSRENNSDYYYSFENEKFKDILKNTVQHKINNTPELKLSMLENFKFTPVAMKKTVIKHYNQYLEASLGTFSLDGDIQLLSRLYSDGIGSRTAMGFGYFNVIDNNLEGRV